MKTTYSLGTADDGYCLTCGTLGKCIERLFNDLKNSDYREINDYTICKVKHPDNLTLDCVWRGDCYLLNESGEIPHENDEILEKGKTINLKKSDLKFLDYLYDELS